MHRCPFKPGDLVIYRPSKTGAGKSAMTDLRLLRRGERYRIARVEKDAYLVLEGFEDSPTGGLHWSEFEPAPTGSSV
jgi:hypothetical protein